MAKAAKAPVETELKLALSEEGQSALTRHAAFRAAPARRRHEVTTYFDTADQRLHRHGFTLRVRRRDGRFIQTVKAAGAAAVAGSRREWEWPIPGEMPALDRLAKLDAKWPAVRPDELRPVVVTEIERETRQLALGGTVAEAAIDVGSIVAGEAREPVRELELELREGSPAALYRLAITLHGAEPLEIGSDSKAARGYRLATGERPSVAKSHDPDFPKTADAAAVFAQAVALGLDQLLTNRAAAWAGDAEGVHQMRVAIRRLRAALLLFKPYLEPHATARFEDELRRIGQVFGEARDWDVFCLEALATKDGTGWTDVLRPAADRARRVAHDGLAAETHAPAFTALVLGLAAWAEDGRADPALLGDATMARPLADLAPDLLDRLERKVTKRGRHIDALSGPELHSLRKSLKKLRYGIDCVAALYPGKRVKAYVGGCKALQEALGTINDTAMAPALADRLAADGGTQFAPATAALARSLAERRADALDDLGRAWKKFGRARPFWI